MQNFFSVILLVGFIIYQTYSHREKLRQLKFSQIAGIVLTYLLTIAVATIIIYFGGNWLANLFPTTTLKTIIFTIVVIVTFIGLGLVVPKVLTRITGGIFSEDE